MTESYTPIACGLHDEYECAILLRHILTVRWQENGAWHEDSVRPLAIETVAGEEFLTFEVLHGARHRVRLDRIRLR